MPKSLAIWASVTSESRFSATRTTSSRNSWGNGVGIGSSFQTSGQLARSNVTYPYSRPESRKGAASEFRLRLEHYTDRSVKRLPHLLYFTRLSTGSLSRDEFKVGWAHQTRRAFSNYMHHWHENSAPEDLVAPDDQELIPGIPEKFRSLQRKVRHYDYVFLSDWRWDDATTTGALEELRSLREAGYAVAIMQLNGTLPEPTPSPRLTHRVQEYI